MKINKLSKIVCFFALIGMAICFIIKPKSNADISDLYTLMPRESETYELIVKNKRGKVVFQEQYATEPIVETVYNDTLLVTRGRGSWHIYTFINTETGLVSEGFSDISTWNHEKVVYATFEDDVIKIIVQAIYDRNEYYMEILRNFSPEAIPYRIILRAEFMNDSQLLLEYYSGENWEEVSEIINL